VAFKLIQKKLKFDLKSWYNQKSGDLGCANLGHFYTWGQIEGWFVLSKVEPIGLLNSSKFGPRNLYKGWVETTTHPICCLRWHSFGSKPSVSKEEIETRFWMS